MYADHIEDGGQHHIGGHRAVEIERFEQVGETARDVLSGAGIEPLHARLDRGLHADPVPFPFGHVIRRVERAERVQVRRGREHDRAERRKRGRNRLLAALQPGEEAFEGRGEAVPELLDLLDRDRAEFGQRGAGEAGGDADAEPAGRELEVGVTRRRRETVEPGRDHAGKRGLAGRLELVDEFGERRIGGVLCLGPDERDGLGQVADEIVGAREELRVHALVHQPAEQRRRDVAQVEVSGQRAERQPALRVGARAEVLHEVADLAVPLGREGEGLEEAGEVLHPSGSSSKPIRCSGRDRLCPSAS